MSEQATTTSATRDAGSGATFYTRQASGLVRDISPTSSIALNVSFVSIPLAVLIATQAPSSFPGASPFWVAVICAVLCIFPVLLYSLFTSVMPRSGGDYVFVSRSLGPWLGLAASICAAAGGAAVITACGDRLGPKHGVTPADVLAALGGPARPSAEQSEAMLARAGVALVHAGAALPGWDALAVLRDEIGLRGPIHSAEKLVDWFGARRFVVGHTHGSYGPRLLGALAALGADCAVAVRGIEGSDLLRPGRPSALTEDGPLELPERLGMRLRGDPDPQLAAALTRAVLAGDDDGAARHAVAMSAAVRLLAAGVVAGPAEALARAEAVLAEGRALATLDALVG